MSQLTSQLKRALERRQPLIDDPGICAIRLFHGLTEGEPGLVIEQFNDILIAQVHEGRRRASLEQIRDSVEWLYEAVGAKAVYRKHFVRDRAQADDAVDEEHHRAIPWMGDACEPEITIVENDVRLLIHPYEGFSVGLFLEHRDNRRRVRDLSTGRRVLNTFSYTCGFSAAAAIGGAEVVDSIDLSKRYLEWGKDNFAANDIDPEPHRFFCSDTFDFFKRAQRQQRRYGLIVLDPPTFARMRRPARTFELRKQLPALCSGAIDLLEPDGVILLAVNDQQLAFDQLESTLQDSAGRRSCDIIERAELPADFAGDVDYSKAVFARIG